MAGLFVIGRRQTTAGNTSSFAGYSSPEGTKIPGGGGGGDSHMKWTGMLVVSLRGVNFGFWSCLGCSGQNVIIFSRKGLV